jgi:hypothetical protein
VDVLLRDCNLMLQVLTRVEMKPRLVMKRMTADFMPCVGNRPQEILVMRKGRVLADHEKRNPKGPLLQETQNPGYNYIQIAGKVLPPTDTPSFHVCPLIVQVER